MAKQITKKELQSLHDDMIAMQKMIKEQSINNQSIANFIINHMFVNNLSCVNSHSSSCVSCPYRYDCSCYDCDVVVLSSVVS